MPAWKSVLVLNRSKTPKQGSLFLTGSGFLFLGLAGDFDLLEFFEGGFYLGEVVAAYAANEDAGNDAALIPISETATADFQFFCALFRRCQIGGAASCGWCLMGGLRLHSSQQCAPVPSPSLMLPLIAPHRQQVGYLCTARRASFATFLKPSSSKILDTRSLLIGHSIITNAARTSACDGLLHPVFSIR